MDKIFKEKSFTKRFYRNDNQPQIGFKGFCWKHVVYMNLTLKLNVIYINSMQILFIKVYTFTTLSIKNALSCVLFFSSSFSQIFHQLRNFQTWKENSV